MEGDVWVLLSGWAARIRHLPGKSRQVLHLILPGDMIGIPGSCWAGGRLPVETVTPVIVADASPIVSALKLGLAQYAGLSEACQRASWCEQVYCLDAMVRLGQQTARERLSHLLLETYMRLESVGLVSSGGFHLPVTQDFLAHALGLSLVHLSRTLRQMRREGVIAMEGGHIKLLRPDVLASAANFPYVITLLE
jgi:Crp-like helix-turn-helix protein